jgi:hypothetical protein
MAHSLDNNSLSVNESYPALLAEYLSQFTRLGYSAKVVLGNHWGEAVLGTTLKCSEGRHCGHFRWGTTRSRSTCRKPLVKHPSVA